MDTVKQAGAEFWNANPCGGEWSNYREFAAWIQQTEPYAFSVLRKYDWQNKRVVEVGCGQGTTLNYLPQYGANVVGIDMSVGSILGARAGAQELKIASKISLAQGDAEKLPFADASCDCVISFGVLHHTSDTAAGIQEIYRLLKPGGRAIVMLYRSGNPKWWMTRLLRGYAWLVDQFTGEKFYLANRLRARREAGNRAGTALLELFGVPVLKAFSNRQSSKMFTSFTNVKISNHSPGFRRLTDISSQLQVLTPVFEWLDRSTQSMWGFYQVIEAQK